MSLSALTDRLLGRTHLDIDDGGVRCPVRSGRVDIESCPSCPYWNRMEMDRSQRGVVVCRPRTLCGGEATRTPPG